MSTEIEVNNCFVIYSQQKKLRKLCLLGFGKISTPFLDFLISESYEVSNLLQKGALFEFLAPIVAEKNQFQSRLVFMPFFAKLQYCLVKVKSATVKFYPIYSL